MKLTEEALDLKNKILSVGAEIEKGFVVLYHRTDLNGAEAIKKLKYFIGKEDEIFFSTRKSGQADGYGSIILTVKIHLNNLELDDIFENKAHLRVPLKKENQKFFDFKIVK